ncbi:hypothetical protein SLS56_012047, partial [Neofusicoccum ribis]
MRGDSEQQFAIGLIPLIPLSDPRNDFEELKNEKPLVLNTCTWVFRSQEFIDWRDNEAVAMVGITGNPGIGKTVISIFLVGSLKQHFTGFERTIQGPIYFFCESFDRKCNSDIAILRGLLYQLCQIEGMKKHFYNECKLQKEPKENMLQSFQTLWRILCKMIEDEDASGLIIIIDALDE